MSVRAEYFSLLLLAVAASVNASHALRKRSDDVSPEAMMTLIQQQAAVIQELQAKLSSTETQLSSVETELNSVKTSLEAKTQQQSQSIADLNARLSVVNSSLFNINHRLDTNVLFTAHTSKVPTIIGDSSPIQFDAVVTNVGGGYNPTTGVFTAPVSGVYVLYAQLMKHDHVSFIWWAMDKSGTALCMNHLQEDDTYDKSSCLATTRLGTGEQVFVRREKGEHALEGGTWCSFSGFLLSRDA